MTDDVTLTFLGTCGGPEPMPGRHHCSFVIEHHGRLYWFDAGESCSYTAYLAGINLPSTEAIFISHTHIDHTAGLPNLIWTLSKVTKRSRAAFDALTGRTIKVFIPNLDVWDGILRIVVGDEGEYRPLFKLCAKRYESGVISNENGMRVIALRNSHLGDAEHALSFSFRAEIGSKSIVHSGDVGSIEECEPLLDDCNLLLMETGHHKVEDVCTWLKESQKRVDQLIFLHHGRAILADPEGELSKAKEILGEKVSLANDGMVIQL